ncbi:YbaB/EbfC family nucleoid-associated protein [Aldersonia sp. NBC_00410]|uniref:YbaB/EbfC family nucleoid-associated protein n=1 Tax=Aldersonia sp. NBC_00410 TaxID=2975954 RepID=UPI00224F3FBD|nr:YbaB/EbfC family nucleoid-associated protein [Aldersonia sp. NBC_00410]MCX5044472.1 YbaB/EbfC family nucleoid-associated protein [Aldersonia sp. NBC_00410]
MSGNEMDALVASATARLENLEAALHGISQVRGVATAQDGLVTAEVDGNGALVDLRLAEAITAHPPAEIGPLVTRTCAEAAVDAARQRARVIERLSAEFGGQVG